MSVSTTLTLTRVPSLEETLQKAQYNYQSVNNTNASSTNNNNNSITSSATYYHFPSDIQSEYTILNFKNEPRTLTSEETLLLEKTKLTNSHANATNGLHMQKSSSYHGTTVKGKSTIIKQDSLNGRINTTLTDSDSEYASYITMAPTKSPTSSSPMANEAEEEHDSFLVGSSGETATTSSSTTNRRLNRSSSKTRSSMCYRANAFISRNWYLSYLVPLSILLALMFVAYLTRDYAKRLLYWIETQNPWIIFAIFMLLFVIVSFPIVVGYFVLMITAGYLFGCIKGFLTVILGANMGIAIAHLTLRSLRHRLPIQKLIKNETGRAILRVISGPRAFRVVLFTRLTPIPFGIQNAIFGVSTINSKVYHTATFLGLLPAQLINVYLGSTLRSMHEVLNNHGTAVTGYISFGVEVICGVALMFWVVQKARKELSETLLTDISSDGKLIDIQV
ncbi:uncharacterized protein LOC135955984 [Calliphora vicina]|uniref:uncharacterized protein LOC135955984 n=1 Tax=Calliphora vicina TaxID=7373 RepID=UPI00325A77F8